MDKKIIINELEKKWTKARSKWGRAVIEDAINILDGLDDSEILEEFQPMKKQLLRGAENWNEYSWGGCALVYDYDIAKHYCTPSELKRTKNGERRPNAREEWLDTQARALGQACGKIWDIIKYKKMGVL